MKVINFEILIFPTILNVLQLAKKRYNVVTDQKINQHHASSFNISDFTQTSLKLMPR